MKVTRRGFGGFLVASGLTAFGKPLFALDEMHHGTKEAMEAPEARGEGKKSVGILLYDGALVLDFGIAGELFAAADFQKEYNVWTFSIGGAAVTPSLMGEMRPAYSLKNAPKTDVIIIPGGMHWPAAANNAELQNFLHERHEAGTILMAVCTGAFILAKGGFLDGRRAITNYQGLPLFRKTAPNVIVAEGEEFVDLGDIVTTAGSGTAMNATLSVIERLSGKDIARDLGKRYLDYPYLRV